MGRAFRISRRIPDPRQQLSGDQYQSGENDQKLPDGHYANGMPAQTTGFLYVNLTSSLPLVRALGPLLGLKLPEAQQADLSALKTLTAFGTRAGEESTFTVFLEIR